MGFFMFPIIEKQKKENEQIKYKWGISEKARDVFQIVLFTALGLLSFLYLKSPKVGFFCFGLVCVKFLLIFWDKSKERKKHSKEEIDDDEIDISDCTSVYDEIDISEID